MFASFWQPWGEVWPSRDLRESPEPSLRSGGRSTKRLTDGTGTASSRTQGRTNSPARRPARGNLENLCDPDRKSCRIFHKRQREPKSLAL